ncbi:toxin CbtA, partial [Escherichia coli NE037]
DRPDDPRQLQNGK